MISHDVSLLRHAADNIRRGLDHIAHDKEGGRSPVLFQRVQNLLRVSVFVAAVKGQVDHLLGGVAHKTGVVPGQLLRRGVSHRAVPLGLEGKPPVVRGYRYGRGRGGRHGGAGGVEHKGARQGQQRQGRQQSGPIAVWSFFHKNLLSIWNSVSGCASDRRLCGFSTLKKL